LSFRKVNLHQFGKVFSNKAPKTKIYKKIFTRKK
jgi:hypothetical protein